MASEAIAATVMLFSFCYGLIDTRHQAACFGPELQISGLGVATFGLMIVCAKRGIAMYFGV